jgi:transposase
MVNAVLDARQEGDSYRRVEVITGERRRRRWTGEEKPRIVAESFEERANISEVARRNGVARGLLTVWRGQVTAMAGMARTYPDLPWCRYADDPPYTPRTLATSQS